MSVSTEIQSYRREGLTESQTAAHRSHNYNYWFYDEHFYAAERCNHNELIAMAISKTCVFVDFTWNASVCDALA